MDSPRNEGKDYFEINQQTGEVFTKVVFDREKQGAYALEVEARDGAPSARPNSDDQPNSGEFPLMLFMLWYILLIRIRGNPNIHIGCVRSVLLVVLNDYSRISH